MLKKDILYSLSDITVIPCVDSGIRSRKQCRPYTSGLCGEINDFLPIVTAPMDSVVDDTCYKNFLDSGISPIIPRTVSLEKRLDLCKKIYCAFSLSEVEDNFLNKDWDGPLNVLIDIANGHMCYQIKVGAEMRERYKDKLRLGGGNIANPDTYTLYDRAGFDFVRCGIGGGRGCLTGVSTAIYYPAASLLDEIRKIKGNCKVIADGGIRTYSDVIKCLALGADYVMMGYTLAKASGSAGTVAEDTGKKLYYGMSSKIAQAKILGVDLEENRRNLKTSEGRLEEIELEYTLKGWTENMTSYLRSAMSYTGASNLWEFRENAICQVISQSTIKALDK